MCSFFWHHSLHDLSSGQGLQVTSRCLWVHFPFFPSLVFGLARPCTARNASQECGKMLQGWESTGAALGPESIGFVTLI